MTISAAQCRAARALLAWSQDDLSEKAHVSKKTVADFERGERKPYPRNIDAMRATLEGGGIEFIPKNEGGSGVRFREPEP